MKKFTLLLSVVESKFKVDGVRRSVTHVLMIISLLLPSYFKSLRAQINCPPGFTVDATFDYYVMGGPIQTATLISNGVLDSSEIVTIDICDGETYVWLNITSNVTHGFISQLSSNGNVLGIPASPPPTEIPLVDDLISNINLFIYNGSSYSLSLVNPNAIGTITQKIIFYSDMDGSNDFDSTIDCYGDTMIINYIVRPQPGLIAQMNNTNLTSARNGITDTSTFSVCSGLANNVQITAAFQELNNMPNTKIYQVLAFTNATITNYCSNCAAPVGAFVPPTPATASLINNALPGTVTISFIPWFDRNNDNDIDIDECVGDTARYVIQVGLPPVIQCPANAIVGCAADVASLVPVDVGAVTVLTNACHSPAVVEFDNESISNIICPNQFTINRTYRASNACCAGSFSYCTQIITVKDSIGPSVICPANITVTCSASVPAPNPSLLLMADDCGNINLQGAFIGDSISNVVCVNDYILTRRYSATDMCGNSKTCAQTIRVRDNVRPNANCRDLTVSLDISGQASIQSVDLDNGSTDNCAAGISNYQVSDSTFTCDDIGINTIQLTVTDFCGNTDSENCTVTVVDSQPPVLVCPDNRTINLAPGECGRVINYLEPYAQDNCDVEVTQIDATGLSNGSFFPIGTTCLQYQAVDQGGNRALCTFCFSVVEYPRTRFEIVCNDNVQISLDDSCRATVGADMILEGDIYGCYDGYVVQLRDWNAGPRGPIIDREPGRRGAQLNYLDVGRMVRITVIDPVTGNSCWGIGLVEDKLPPILECPRDTVVLCTSSLEPEAVGTVGVYENCGPYELTYKDTELKGSCLLGYERIITRVFTAIDLSGNIAKCTQTITVNYASLADITFPPHYTLTDSVIIEGYASALKCEEKADLNFDVSAHLRSSPECVDAYLLDEPYFLLTGKRRPRTLGWNCIPNGEYKGHPSPYNIYYPAHPDGKDCYGSGEVILWHGTGVPQIAGCGNLAMSFSDIKVDIAQPGCDAGDVGCYKIIRKWTILDWCTGVVFDSNQLIKVLDFEGPQIIYPDKITVVTDVWRCVGQWDVAKVWVTDNCSNDIKYTIWIDDGIVLGNQESGYVVVEIPVGEHRALIIAEDCCGNITEKEITVHVLDRVPPTAVCDQRTTITITGNLSPEENFAKVFAQSFDDGSFDNCSPHIFFKVIRMDELLGTNNGSKKGNKNFCRGANGDDDLTEPGNQIYFDDFTKFCCEDAGTLSLVVLRVFDVDPGPGPINPSRMSQGGDLFGRFSDCMVEVVIQDKSVPVVVAPPDIVVSCDFWFDKSRLTDPGDSLFGRVVKDIAWRNKVVTKDIVCAAYCERNEITGYPGFIAVRPGSLQPAPNIACNYYNTLYQAAHPDSLYELFWGLDGYAITACGVEPRIVVRDLRDCGQGKILRDIIATGPGGATIRATQTIWVVNCDPFWANPTNHCDTTDNIIWPDCAGVGTTVFGCGADVSPAKIGKPVLLKDQKDHCALLAVEHFDQIFTIENDACYKILRKWVVIDWCQYDPHRDPNRGRWEHSQWIKVHDRIAPVVTCSMGPCEPAAKSPTLGVCVAHISLTAAATDSCTQQDWLKFEYKIDLFNNGSFDYAVGALTRFEFSRGFLPPVRNNPFADNANNPFNASGTYPIGVHRIKWFVEDGCGNIGVCEKLFEIKDCKAPTPYCLTGIVTTPMQTMGCVDIWAKDLDAGSFDNCTDKGRLSFYFAEDRDSTYMRVCCSDFERARQNVELTIPVKVCVEDVEGNRDCCHTTVTVQDPNNICPDVSPAQRASIIGTVKTEFEEACPRVEVAVLKYGTLERLTTTAADGKYAFYSLDFDQEYEIVPSRNDNPLNGVTTLDILLIQRHILDIRKLNSPYKMLAADVNMSKSITAADMAEIRRLILGVREKFARVESWMFVDKAHSFANPNAPWDFPPVIKRRMENSVNELNVVAIKMGDVNESVLVDFKDKRLSSRSFRPFVIFTEDKEVNTGDEFVVTFHPEKSLLISGMQMALNMDTNAVEFLSISSNSLDLKNEHYVYLKNTRPQLRICWHHDRSVHLNQQVPLIELKLRAKNSGKVSEIFHLDTELIQGQVYDENLHVYTLGLEMRGEAHPQQESAIVLYAPVPNPVRDQATIAYRLAYDSEAVLTFYNATGKVFSRYNVKGRKGMNYFSFRARDIGASGLFYIQLDARDYTATQKLVIMD